MAKPNRLQDPRGYLVRNIIRMVERLYRYLPWFPVRPVMLLDGQIKQMDWFEFSAIELQWQGLKRGMVVLRHTCDKTVGNVTESEPPNLQQIYRGVRLFPVVEYGLYMSLGIARHEFDVQDSFHCAHLTRWMAHARTVVDDVVGKLRRVRPHTVVIHQGHFTEAAVARQLSTSMGFRILALESTLHSKRMVCEPFTGLAVNRNSAMTYFSRRDYECANQDDVTWLSREMRQIDANKHSDHASPEGKFAWPEGRRRILFLAQCFTDSSVLFGSSVSAIEISRCLIQYAERNHCFALLKLHPKELSGNTPLGEPYNRLTLRRLLAAGVLQENGEGQYSGPCHAVDFANSLSTPELIADSDVVVTINSQGGIEALAAGKETILLGESFYDRLGITWNLSHLCLLAPTLDIVLREGVRIVNRTILARFLDAYFYDYCVSKTPAGLATAIRNRGRINWPNQSLGSPGWNGGRVTD